MRVIMYTNLVGHTMASSRSSAVGNKIILFAAVRCIFSADEQRNIN